METLCILALTAISLRWMIYRHKAFGWFQEWLERGSGLRKELSICIYCQTMQAAIAVVLVHIWIVPDIQSFVPLAAIFIAPWLNYLWYNND